MRLATPISTLNIIAHGLNHIFCFSEYDSEMDDFIDDSDAKVDISAEIRNIFGYDRRKFRHEVIIISNCNRIKILTEMFNFLICILIENATGRF